MNRNPAFETNVYESGDMVALNSSQGPIVRVVVRDLGGVVEICRREEFQNAKSDMRKPFTIGFRKSDIIKRMPYGHSD